jgi:hypothetical protein
VGGDSSTSGGPSTRLRLLHWLLMVPSVTRLRSAGPRVYVAGEGARDGERTLHLLNVSLSNKKGAHFKIEYLERQII